MDSTWQQLGFWGLSFEDIIDLDKNLETNDNYLNETFEEMEKRVMQNNNLSIESGKCKSWSELGHRMFSYTLYLRNTGPLYMGITKLWIN